MNKKFEIIVESYYNGNISWVKSEVKKLSKQARKELFIYFTDLNTNKNENTFNLKFPIELANLKFEKKIADHHFYKDDKKTK